MSDYDDSSFYPSDLLAEYKSISVRAEYTVVSVSINKYRCRIYGGGTEDAEAVKDGFISASGGQIVKEAGGGYPYVDVFTGKGSPYGIARVLGLVHEYRHAFIRKHRGAGGAKGDCADLLADNESNPQAMLQRFCDAYLGLDCNGFVGNYVKRVKKGWMGPQTSPKVFYQSGKSRKTSDDTWDLDALVWKDFTHIAIIDTFEDAETVNICQSTGGGPQISQHRLVRSGPGLFNIEPPTKVNGPVYAVGLGL